MKRLILLLSIFAIAPLAHPEFFWGAHDGRHSVYFLVEFDRSIQDGIFWPRWAPDFAYGYGYPIFNIYAPLAFFVGEAFHLVGFDFVTSVKIVFALGFVLSGLAMYWFARDLLGARGAALAAVVYVYAPYRLVDVYVRGALAESFAFVFLPLVLGSFRRLIAACEVRRLLGPSAPSPLPAALIAALSLAGLILTHNSIALLFIPITAFYVCWQLARIAWPTLRQPRAAIAAILRPAGWSLGAAIVALTLSAIFWLPMIAEYNDVRTDQWTTADYDFRDNFVYPHQLLSPFWGYGLSRPGPDDEMPFQLGVVPVLLALFGLIGGRRRGVTADRAFFALLAAGSTFLVSPLSAPIWEAGKAGTGLVQFPFRLLAFSTLGLAFLAGLAASGGRYSDSGSDTRDRIALGALLLLTVFGSYRLLNPPMFAPVEGPVSLGALMRFEQSSGELVGLTRWNTVKPTDSPLKPLYEAGEDPRWRLDRSTIPAGATAEQVRYSSVLDEIRISTAEPFRLGLFRQFYPGWQATINGRPVAIEPMGDLGLQTIQVPAGDSTLIVRFDDTPPRTAGQITSAITVVAMVAAAAWQLRRRSPAPDPAVAKPIVESADAVPVFVGRASVPDSGAKPQRVHSVANDQAESSMGRRVGQGRPTYKDGDGGDARHDGDRS